MSQRQPQPPLEGVRVLAIEQFGAGPWATMMLADLGAEIIKIENPATGGDVGRYVTPYASAQDSLYFQSFNRNKKSITLNLQHPRVTQILHPLAAAADAVFNNLRGDLPARLGLDYAALKHLKSDLVCCSLSAFGRTGARAAEPGYDYLMQGYAGWMSITGEPEGPPQKSGLSLVDLNAGVCAALGMVSAILRARETGGGGDVEVNLFDAAISQLAYVGAWHLTRGYDPAPTPDSSHPSQIPSQVLPTRDGWLVVMCAKEKFYRNLVRLLDLPELAADPRFASFELRLENRDELIPQLKARTRQKPTAEWLERLKGQVPCAPVNSVAEAFADPQVAADQMVLDLPHPEFGTVKTPAGPIRIDDAAVAPRRGPGLGEHTDEILQNLLALSPDEIAAYRRDGML